MPGSTYLTYRSELGSLGCLERNLSRAEGSRRISRKTSSDFGERSNAKLDGLECKLDSD